MDNIPSTWHSLSNPSGIQQEKQSNTQLATTMTIITSLLIIAGLITSMVDDLRHEETSHRLTSNT